MKKIADLRKPLFLQQKTTTDDGIGGRLTSWSDVSMVWASLEPASGNERYRAQRLEANITHKVLLRHQPGITTKNRLVTKTDGSPVVVDRIFAIKAVINRDEGRERLLELLVTEGDPT